MRWKLWVLYPSLTFQWNGKDGEELSEGLTGKNVHNRIIFVKVLPWIKVDLVAII